MDTYTRHDQEQQGRHRHSGTVGPVSQWQVRATAGNGAVMMFGLAAPDEDLALLAALDRLPWQPKDISVELIPSPGARDGVEA